MRETGTGWPEEKKEHKYRTVPVKLTPHQLEAIGKTDEPVSQWIRDAVQMRLEAEIPGYEPE